MDLSRESIKQNVRDFIMRAARLRSLEYNEEIFSSGLVTSLFAMQLIEHIEREYPLFVEGDDMNVQTFRSVDAISEFIVRKMSLSTAAPPPHSIGADNAP